MQRDGSAPMQISHGEGKTQRGGGEAGRLCRLKLWQVQRFPARSVHTHAPALACVRWRRCGRRNEERIGRGGRDVEREKGTEEGGWRESRPVQVGGKRRGEFQKVQRLAVLLTAHPPSADVGDSRGKNIALKCVDDFLEGSPAGGHN